MRRNDSRRSHRLSDLIMRETATILARKVKDPRLEWVTVSGCRINTDGTVAEVLYTIHDESQADEVKDALERAHGYIRTTLVKQLNMKKLPDLRFVRDDFLETMIYE